MTAGPAAFEIDLAGLIEVGPEPTFPATTPARPAVAPYLRKMTKNQDCHVHHTVSPAQAAA